MGQDIMLYAGAVALGALHAFEPGHGKTIIAAYMIGSRGRALDGLLLGLIVTFTHTFSVLILGVIARILAHSYTEAQLHGWLGLFSALLILAVGIWMLQQRLKKSGGHTHIHLFGTGHDHSHGPQADKNCHGHDHHHDLHHEHSHEHHTHHDDDQAHDHPHPHDHRGHQPPARDDKWSLLFLGISGGLVPCPAAIATLLAAIAAGRIAQGLTLAIFFSLGLGLVMMSIGVLLSQAGRLTKKIDSHPEFSRRMGILSAAIITVLGSITLFHSVKTLWF